MKITVSGLTEVNGSLDRSLKDLIQRVTTEVYVAARANTPVKTGNARSKWNRGPGTVENSVPYIERLEAGASKQAPRGIIGPTLSQVKGKFK